MGRVISDHTWFLNSDKSKAVEEDSPEAAFLLVRAGMEADEAELEKYGLLEDGDTPKRVQKSKAKALPEPEPEPEDETKHASKKSAAKK